MIRLFFCLMTIFLIDCGQDEPRKQIVVKAPADVDQLPFRAIAVNVAENCALSGCHDGNNQREFNQSNFFDSNAKARVEGNTMPPPPRRLSAADKSELLAWFEGS